MHSFGDFDKRWEESKQQHKRFIRTAIILKCVAILCAISSVFFLQHALEKGKDERDIQKSRIGEYVVINKDTLQILDYSTWAQTYTLSNGTEVAVQLVDKLKGNQQPATGN